MRELYGREDGTGKKLHPGANLHTTTPNPLTPKNKEGVFKIAITYNSWYYHYSLRKTALQVEGRFWNAVSPLGNNRWYWWNIYGL